MPLNSKIQSSVDLRNQASLTNTNPPPSPTLDQFVGRSATSVEVSMSAYYGSTRLTLELWDCMSRLKESSREKIEQRWKIFSEDILRLICDSSFKETIGSQGNTSLGTLIGQGSAGLSGQSGPGSPRSG